MKLELDAVTKGAKARVLAPTSVAVESGQAALVQAETEQRPTVLGLIASGRMQPDEGSVRIDGRTDPRALRLASALVDAPDVSDPDADVLTVGVVAEELMYAGRKSNPIAARKWMSEHGYDDIALAKIGTVEPSRRIRILADLAAERSGAELVVIVSPDRHGGRPQAWWRVAEDLADRGLAVLVIAGRASWQVLLGEDHGPDFADGMPTVDVEPLVLPDPESGLAPAATATTRTFSTLDDQDHDHADAAHDVDVDADADADAEFADGADGMSPDPDLPVFDATVHEDQEAGTLHVVPAPAQDAAIQRDPDPDAAVDTGDIGDAELVFDADPTDDAGRPTTPEAGDAAPRDAAEDQQ